MNFSIPVQITERAVTRTSANLYCWFLRDAEREISRDFPLLGRMHSDMAKAYIGYLAQFPSDERLRRATGRLIQ